MLLRCEKLEYVKNNCHGEAMLSRFLEISLL